MARSDTVRIIMKIIDKNLNQRIITLASIVVVIATVAMILQFMVFYEIGVANVSQVFVVSGTAIMQMSALLILTLQKTRTNLQEAQNLAYIDELTGLVNRRKFNEILELHQVNNKTNVSKIAVLILDLDRFKLINDCYGHDAGDKVICQFGERIQSVVDKNSVTCRMSGDEFSVLIKNVTSRGDVLQTCKQILKAMEQPFSYEGKEIKTSVSIGAAVIDGTEDTDLSPLRMADYALFNAKEEGRNNYRMFNCKMAAQIKRRRNLERGLSNAISGDMLTLKYQPFVSQDASSISGVEALIRWDHPEEGEILPAEFLPVAQERGMIDKIGKFILERACSEIKPLKDIRLAVNINPAQFTQKGFVDQVKRVLKKTGFEPWRLELELGQNLLVSKSEKIRTDLQALRDLGVRIVLDDFGTSYSSMLFLREFKLDRIKLDRNFVSSMQHEKDGDEIIQNMIGLGSTFSDKLTVEGVETEEQLAALQHNGVNDLQGFFFSKPLTLAELETSKMVVDLRCHLPKEKLAQNVKLPPINRMAS